VTSDPTWPDGHYVHGHNVLVKLGCGHYRVSKGWRGSAGEAYCCDACHQMTVILATIITFDDEPHDWRLPAPESYGGSE